MDYMDQSPMFNFSTRTHQLWPNGMTMEEARDEGLLWEGKMAVCYYCGGDGRHSRHLGAMSGDEFEDAFPEDEDKDRYLSGYYDMECEICKGLRVVVEFAYAFNDDEATARYNEFVRDEESYRREVDAERRMGA